MGQDERFARNIGRAGRRSQVDYRAFLESNPLARPITVPLVMPTRSELTDTRDWSARTWKGGAAATLKPGEPFPDEAATPTYAVTFLDRKGAVGWAHRPAQMDCLPTVFVRLEPQGIAGYMRRTWTLEMSKGGPVYREQAPTRYQYVEGKPGKAGGKAVDEEAWDGGA